MVILKVLFVVSFNILLAVAQFRAVAWAECGAPHPNSHTYISCEEGYACSQITENYSQCIPAPTSNLPTRTSSASAASGSQIRTVQDPVYHFYLQDLNGVPVLGPESSSGYFTIGSTISINYDDGSSKYLNLNSSATTSYKSLSLDATATTTNWGLEGDTIITTAPRQLNFIACSTTDAKMYNVYLQDGNDTPSDASCTLVTLHLPCLC